MLFLFVQYHKTISTNDIAEVQEYYAEKSDGDINRVNVLCADGIESIPDVWN